MVASNPLFRKWTLKKFGATVLDDIWPEVIFFTSIAVVVDLVSTKTSTNLGVSNQLLTVLGLVLGLVISFRTSSAYERYQEGGKMWTNITVACRNLAQMIWIHIPDERSILPGQERAYTPLESIIEKKTMINLHLLRGEQGVYYEDLYPLISFLPRYANGAEGDEHELLPLWRIPEGSDVYTTTTPIVHPEVEPKTAHDREKTMVEDPNNDGSVRSCNRKRGHMRVSRMNTFDPEALLPQLPSDYPLRPARNPPVATMYDYFPFLRFFRWVFKGFTRRQIPPGQKRGKRKAYTEAVENHVPLEIFMVLSKYLSPDLMKNNLVQPSIAGGITDSLSLLVDTVSNLERICNTPLPFAYQAHLRMSLWVYLALLPFQIFSSYSENHITIPATAFSSFLLLGFLEIGHEIENPFNYDLNDLGEHTRLFADDLDYFCLTIQRELHAITTHTNPDPSTFIFSPLNQPLAPSDRRHAEDLVNLHREEPYKMPDPKHAAVAEPGMGSIRRALVTGWKMVDTHTRGK
ncbi:hypothetical protein CPC08DRAFT_712723 [Agrocybe pediades]|nr:hypothetical protein CPC08DRAFT_712723 [Agrocybe pediades]